MIKYSRADGSMEDGIREIFYRCFPGSEEEYNLFFKQMYDREKAMVGTLNGKPVCALYLLDAQIIQEKEFADGYYVYGAGTFPENRRQGYMRGLILYAVNVAQSQGKKFLSLIPANSELYKFYENLGFYKFFKQKKVSLTQTDMEKLSIGGQSDNIKLSSNLNDILQNRDKIFNSVGDVKWALKHINYNIELNNLYGGETFFTEHGYAICKKNKDTVEISELCTEEERVANIICKIYSEYKCKNYVFTVQVESKVLKQEGKIDFLGMIKPLRGNNITGVGAYLGLGMN